MRTAEEILKEYGHWGKPELIKGINEARREAIKECAEVATAFPLEIQDDFEMAVPQIYLTSVDKQSILKLIDQVK